MMKSEGGFPLRSFATKITLPTTDQANTLK
jgi:hypothetical protein